MRESYPRYAYLGRFNTLPMRESVPAICVEIYQASRRGQEIVMLSPFFGLGSAARFKDREPSLPRCDATGRSDRPNSAEPRPERRHHCARRNVGNVGTSTRDSVVITVFRHSCAETPWHSVRFEVTPEG
jgi:hypothetical protein